MRHAVRAPEPPPRPLEEEEREDDDSSDDFGDLLSGFREEPLDGEEDDAVHPAAEFDIDELLDSDTFDEQTAPDLRFGHDSVLPEEDDGGSGDASGVLGEAHAGDDEPEDALPADDEERDGIDDSRPLVSEVDLPGLDADEPGGDADVLRFGAFLAATEVALPSAREAWRVTTLSPERERCSSLALVGGTAVAGSTDLLWVDPERSTPVRIALDGTRVAGLTLLGETGDTAVAVTVTGRLLRRGRFGSEVERLGELARPGEHPEHSGRAIELCALGASEPRALLVRLTQGLLERSSDAGSSLEPVEPLLRAIALSSSASPVAALTDGGRELSLSSDGARTFERRLLSSVALRVATGDAPRVAAAERTLAIADNEGGLVVSTDRGETFREVPGCISATACAVGVHAGRMRVWVALYSETADATRIAMVDAERADAEIVATLVGAGDDEQGGVGARLEALGWDGTRLFAVGEPGFLLLEPPAAESGH